MTGVVSHIADDIVPSEGTLRVRFQIDNSEAVRGGEFPDHERMEVRIRARVYDLDVVNRRGVIVPESFVAEGPAITSFATNREQLVDLVLPHMPPGKYGVVAKVTSSDPRHPGEFRPSNCFMREVEFGRRFLIDVESLHDIFGPGTGNPQGDAEIRALVRRGEVIARDRDGVLYRAVADAPTGDLRLLRLRRQRTA